MEARYGAGAIEGVLLTHLDEDHSGGLRSLLSVLPVGCIEMSRHHRLTPEGIRLANRIQRDFPGIRIRESGCIRSSRVAWFESNRKGAAGNRWMAGVVHRLGKGQGYLSLGDGDGEQEQAFYRRFERDISSMSRRIWKAGHHGSKFSSDGGFLRKIGASEVWLSVGRRNRYGHPATEALARLRASGAAIRRTDQEGDLVSTE
jgi:competence protein ComEC